MREVTIISLWEKPVVTVKAATTASHVDHLIAIQSELIIIKLEIMCYTCQINVIH